MSRKDNTGFRGTDGSDTRHQGESQQAQHTGAPGMSKKGKEPHRKNDSQGAERNPTKKGPNSI